MDFVIMRELFRGGRMRFNLLRERVSGISQKMLSQELKQMEQDGLIERKAYAEVPPRVEYSLTRLGRSLRGVLSEIHDWGTRYQDGEFV